ncbi:uncharacterized protein A1O9_06928 [Exophiala aquamarina CBS 119918]|uniref:PRISE-like Rossmann-fold domain-containing protein n=1 Tax=Exophiala aquamarina CBS 119918 TaxID=1182545 RepID=A0A072PBU7_9EURO|nr:uncharacterized protein A1O9_06928 [Exophiala aquamarina CBS 119918]KEF56738.1 hypothetical protein A1O9_06928 [Exophiala aquamarina CBS 119918]
MAINTGRHALIMGASGISGWAIVNQLLRGYPQKGIFSKVTAVTNRPLARQETLWPEDESLRLVSGLDLSAGSQQELQNAMKMKIKDIDEVTDIYFYAYRHSSDPNVESTVNTQMLERTITAIDELSKRLAFVVLPSGTKAYGVHLGKEKFPFAKELPLEETLPRIPEPYASQMFYYYLLDRLKSLSQGRKWTWCDIRPDVIPGFVPNSNTYCLAQTLAVYLSLYAKVEGRGQKCPFPGSWEAWNTLSNDSSQDMVAKFSIWASLNPNKTGGESFNVADYDSPASWSERWPVICEWFGLIGTPPVEGSTQPFYYLKSHLSAWIKLVNEHGLKRNLIQDELSPGKGHYQQHIMSELCFNRTLNLGKARRAGFHEVSDLRKTWWTAFDRLRESKGIA